MKIFDKKSSTIIEDEDLKDAKLSVTDFNDAIVKKRAFADIIGARLAMKHFFSKKIEASNLYSLYTIHSIIEDIDIADIYYNGIKIDVRLVFNQDEIFIPKSHFEYDLLPDLYAVLLVQEDLSSADFLGFFEPQDLDKKNANKDFYFFEYEKLIKPEKLKSFLDSFEPKNDFNKTDEDFEGADELFLSLIDKDISEKDKRFLYKKLATNFTLREKLVEFENFETISGEVIKDKNLLKDGLLDIIGAQKLFEGENENESKSELKTEVHEQVLSDILSTDEELSKNKKVDDEFKKEIEEVLGENTTNKEKTANNNLAANIAIGGAVVAGAASVAAAGLTLESELTKGSTAALSASAGLGSKVVEGGANAVSAGMDLAKNLLKDEAAKTETKVSNEFLSEKEYEELLNETEEYLSSQPDTEQKFTEDTIKDNQNNFDFGLDEAEENNNEESKIIDGNQAINLNSTKADDLIAKGLNTFSPDDLIENGEIPENLPKLGFEKLTTEDHLGNISTDKKGEQERVSLDDLENGNIGSNHATETSQDNDLVSLEEFINNEEEQKRKEETKEQLNDTELKLKDEPKYEELKVFNTEITEEPEVKKSDENDLFEKFREIEEDEDKENSQEDLSNTSEDEQNDEFIAELDDFLNDVETSSEKQQKVSEGISSLGDVSQAEDSSAPVYLQNSEENSNEMAIEDATKPTVEPAKASPPENKDLLEALFEKEKITSIDETPPAETKLKFDFTKNKKMVIAASVASVVLASMIISGAVINSQKHGAANLASGGNLATNQIPADTQNPDANMPPQQNMDEAASQNIQQGLPSEAQQGESVSQDMGQAVSNALRSEPVNASVSKVAWEVPEDLAYNDSFRKYLQIAGRSLKLNLQNSLLLATEMAYSNKVIVDLAVAAGGNVQSANILVSSGSKQIDNIVLQSVKETLKYLKMPADELVGQSANLTLIINF